MKSLWSVFCFLLLLHLLALGGFAAWLHMSGRLNEQRMKLAVALFRLPLEEEKRQLQDQSLAAAADRQRLEEAARLEMVADGPASLEQRLAGDSQRDQIALARYDRLQRDISDLRRQLLMAEAQLETQRRQLQQEREAFEQALQREAALRKDRDFQQAVEMYEQLRSKQTKEMFQELIRAGRIIQVIDYLASMQQRKAAAVLSEFKTPSEVVQATDLVQRLRERGVSMLPATQPKVPDGSDS